MVKVRLDDEEKRLLGARAGQLGVSVQGLLVEAALAGGARSLTEQRVLGAELMAIRRLLVALGVNVNQLAKVANATGAIPAETGHTSRAVQRVLARLDQTLVELSPRGQAEAALPEAAGAS